MITEQLRGLGSWQIKLRDTVPARIMNELNLATGGFGLIVVTDTQVQPVGHTSASLRALARYVGVYRERDGNTIGGVGPAVLLGDEDGKCEVVSSLISRTSATLSTWVSDLLPSNGITAGTITNTGTNASGEYQYVSRRAVLDAICDVVGADWRINPDLTLDAAAPGTLFSSYTTPKAIVTRRGIGRDIIGRIGIVPAELANATDLEDYSTKVYVLARQDGLSVASAAAGSVPFYAPNGAALKLERVIDGAQVATADASTVASQQLGRFSLIRQAIRLSTDEYDLPRKVRPGDRLWVYDPETGLADAANAVYYEGSTLTPVTVRVHGVSWPLRSGLGVYFVTPEASPRIIDLSNHYQPESGSASVEVGTQGRTIGGDASLPGLSPTGDTTFRTITGWSAYTPTLGGWTLGNGTLQAWDSYDGRKYRVHMQLDVGSTSNFGTGVLPTFSLRSPVARNFYIGGQWLGIDTSAGNILYGGPLLARYGSPSTVEPLYYPQGVGAARIGSFTSGTGFTWGTGDQMFLDFDAELA